MEFKNKHVLNLKKKSKRTIIIGIVMIIISLVFFYLFFVQDAKDNKNIKYFNDILESDSKIGLKSYLNISWLSSEFAVRDDITDAFYYAYDGNYYYIVFLDKEKATELLNIDLQNNPVKIIGVTKNIPDDVKKIAIEDYNSSIEDGEEKLTYERFGRVFGNIYLDQTSDISDTSSMYVIFGFLLIFGGVIATIAGIISLRKILSRLRVISDVDVHLLDTEMSSSEAFYYNKVKVYLTPNYLILLDGRIIYYKYSDILWMYSYEYAHKSFKEIKAIKILTRDAKTTMFANLTFSTRTENAIYDEIWNTIASKNPNIKLGYNTENVKYFREVVKDIKNYNR